MEADATSPKRMLKIVLILGALAIAGFAIAALVVFMAHQTQLEAYRLRSTNNMRQIVLALSNYEVVNRSLPPHASYGTDGRPLLSWRVLLLPYLEETDQPGLYEEFHLDEPWDSPHNRQLIDRIPKVFQTPGLSGQLGDTSYLAVVDEECAFDGSPEGKRVELLAPELPNAILFVEADSDRAVPWTKPEDWQHDPRQPTAGLGSFRPGGVIVGWTDGKVTTVPTDALQAAPQDFEATGLMQESSEQP